VAGENMRGEHVSRKRTLVPSAASIGRRGSRQERNRESRIHFAGKVGVNGDNIEESALTRELGVRHIVGGTQGEWKALVARAARHKAHRFVLSRKNAHFG